MIFSYKKHTLISNFHFNITIANMNVCSNHLLGVIPMDGIGKVIEELGSIIIRKEIEIESRQEEINSLKKKIESIEQYLNVYENYLNK